MIDEKNSVKTIITIEKEVPVPERNYYGNKGNGKYPFATMVQGDSFFVPCLKEKIPSIRASIYHCSKRQGIEKVAVRAVDGGIRVWCITK